MTGTSRVAFYGSALGIGVMLALLLTSRGRTQDAVVAPEPPPVHVEMDPHPVGGFLLVNPFLADSLGRHPSTVLPDGTVVLIPRLVVGADPSLRRGGS